MKAGRHHRVARSGRARRGLLAGALVAIALQCPAAEAAGCKIQTMELPVRMIGSRAVATVGINGTEVPLVVDTGAFFSMLTPSAAEQLHLSTHSLPRGMFIQGLAGKAEAQATTVDRLQLFKGELPKVDFVVGGNEDVPGTMGLLGRNILTLTDVEYDLAHGMIRLVVPNEECEKSIMAYWAVDRQVAELDLLHGFREHLPGIRARVKINDATVTALFDTGASTLLSLHAAHRAGVDDAAMKPNGKHYGIGTDSVRSWTARIAKVDFGGEAILNNELMVDDFNLPDNDMLLGIDFFL